MFEMTIHPNKNLIPQLEKIKEDSIVYEPFCIFPKNNNRITAIAQNKYYRVFLMQDGTIWFYYLVPNGNNVSNFQGYAGPFEMGGQSITNVALFDYHLIVLTNKGNLYKLVGVKETRVNSSTP